MFRVFQDDTDLGPCWCARPSVEDVDADRFWTEMDFEVGSRDPSTANLSSAGKWQVAMVLEM